MPKKRRKLKKPILGKRKYTKHKKTGSNQIELDPKVLTSISALILYLLALLTILSFFAQGVWLDAINKLFTILFSWQKYLLPLVLFFAGNILLRPKAKMARPTLLLGLLIIMLSSLSLFKTGKIGLEFWQGLSALLSGIGAFLVFFVGILIGLLVFFEFSLIDFIAKVPQIVLKKKETEGVQKDIFTQAEENDLNQDTDWQDESLIKVNLNKPTPPPVAPQLAKPINLPETITKPQSTKISQTGEIEKPPEADFVWQLPPITLLSSALGNKSDGGDLRKNAAIIESTLNSFGVQAKIEEVNKGPTVTQYAIRPKIGTKLTKITTLSNDLALALAAKTGQIRIEAPIPGKSLVGIEVPNVSSSTVPLRKMLDNPDLSQNLSKLAFSLGVDVNNNPVVMDIAKMPHVLIAGQTGSGKSVCINTIIMSILMRATPAEVKFIFVDPKRVELSGYNNIPHLLTPVIIEPEKVLSALQWTVEQMKERYKIFAEVGARNIDAYNTMAGFSAMPYIVIVIDEMADIMLFAPSEVEDAINRLAQMARATGIHLVLATQRPSVNVITGLIKANIPARIAFSVASMMDSRVILDTPGAEKLMGRGDMLFIPPDQAKPRRIQGTFVTDEETKKVTEFWKNTGAPVQYTEEVTQKFKNGMSIGSSSTDGQQDELFEESLRIICGYDRASASLLQRKLKIGYNRAARVMDQLYAAGAVSAQDGQKPREVLVKNPEDFLANLHAKNN